MDPFLACAFFHASRAAQRSFEAFGGGFRKLSGLKGIQPAGPGARRHLMLVSDGCFEVANLYPVDLPLSDWRKSSLRMGATPSSGAVLMRFGWLVIRCYQVSYRVFAVHCSPCA